MTRYAGPRSWRRLAVVAALLPVTVVVCDTVMAIAVSLAGGLPYGTLAASAATLLFLLFAYAVFSRVVDRVQFAHGGLRPGRLATRHATAGLALGAGLMAAVVGIQVAVGWASLALVWRSGVPIMRPDVVDLEFWPAFAGALVFFGRAALAEELAFRAVLMGVCLDAAARWDVGPRMRWLIAVVATSMLFGLVHSANPEAGAGSFLGITLAGVLLGVARMASGGLWLPWAVHAAWNITEGPIFGFAVSGYEIRPAIFAVAQTGPEAWTGGVFGPEAGLLGMLANVAGCAMVWGACVVVNRRRAAAGTDR
ncbi:MAG: type II CAAX endopeptidase family protein [Chloroflexota bacterium]